MADGSVLRVRGGAALSEPGSEYVLVFAYYCGDTGADCLPVPCRTSRRGGTHEGERKEETPALPEESPEKGVGLSLVDFCHVFHPLLF